MAPWIGDWAVMAVRVTAVSMIMPSIIAVTITILITVVTAIVAPASILVHYRSKYLCKYLLLSLALKVVEIRAVTEKPLSRFCRIGAGRRFSTRVHF